MLSIKRLNISNFRNYDAARINLGHDTKFVIISGKNGAGKTNILEAVSLFTSGRGLRNSGLLDMKNRKLPANHVWTVSGEICSIDNEIAKIGTAIDKTLAKRIVRINGENAKNQSSLDEYVSIIWLTPQMDRLFLDSASERRKFLDRLVGAYQSSHSAHINRYEKAMRERLKLMQIETSPDEIWLDTLEKQMAENAISIAAARINLVSHLQEHIVSLNAISPMFPEPEIQLDNWVEQELLNNPAVEVEEKLRQKLKDNRLIDRETKRTIEGTHRINMRVLYKKNNMPAEQCSTGEQKALLVSITLGHALMMQAEKGYVPIILLDEIAAHLDSNRREQLFEVLKSLNGQVWLTGTDKNIFDSLTDISKMFDINNGVITEIKG